MSRRALRYGPLLAALALVALTIGLLNFWIRPNLGIQLMGLLLAASLLVAWLVVEASTD